MIRMIIYDFDGTIADSLAVTIAAYNRIAGEKGLRGVTEDELQALRAKDPREALKELGVSLYQVPHLLYRVLKEVKHQVVNLKPCAGMKELLSEARGQGYQQAILTSNLEESVKGFLRHNQLEIFDFVYCGSGAFGKARALKRLLRDARRSPQEVVYVGDEIRDIEATRKAGIPIICVGWGYNAREALEGHRPQAVIDRPEQLLTEVRKLHAPPT